MTRTTPFGFPAGRPPRSVATRYAPTEGFTELPDVQAPASSIVSGSNVWVRQRRLAPRWGLARAANNALGDAPNGAWVYDDLDGAHYPMFTSKGTIAYLSGRTLVPLSYLTSGASQHPPAGGEGDNFFGMASYLTRRDLALAVFTNGVDPLFAWGGPSDGTGFSTLTSSPIAADIAPLADRIVAWNIQELSASSRFVQRAQWCVAGGPEDWTGIGSGSEDLFFMRGEGTRIFADGDQLVLATDRELARGRKTGDAYVFAFSPLDKEHGIPFPRAALKTPLGLFWLGDDFMVYRLNGDTVEPVGGAIHRTLRDTLVNPHFAFFGYLPELAQLTLYYMGYGDAGVSRAFTLSVPSGTWTPQRFAHDVRRTNTGEAASTSTQWNQLVGSFTSQMLTYQQLAGLSGFQTELVATSNGTILAYSSSAGSDDGQAKNEEALFGALFSADAERVKFLDTLRLDLRAPSASSLTVSVSGNLGGSYQSAARFAVSVQSNTTQHVLHPNVSGAYHALAFQSTGGFWECSGVFAKAHDVGSVL